MSYQSIGFLLFSAVVILLYYLLGRKLQRWVLAAANLAFYVLAGVQYLLFLLTTMLVTYAMGRVMNGIYERSDAALAACSSTAEKKQVKADAKKKAKRTLQIGLLVTIALLVVCKYTEFILTSVNALLTPLGIPQIPVFRMILPLGISFYSFMALSYVLDVYWKRYPAEKSFLTYAVYLSYFPHVVQGPIDRFGEFREQIREGVVFDTKNLAFGSELVIWGLFKKLVIADRLNLFVSHVFDHWSECSSLILFLGVMVYSVQIYADFSGCIDIVTGVSEMFGIRLRKNFNHPYFSKTMAEFWRRWHISLQEWFKDYVYYPVFSSNRMRKVKKCLNEKGKKRAADLFSSCYPILVVWLITGIWHGASWNFVLWGIFHAVLLIGSQVLEPVFSKALTALHINVKSRLWQLWQMVRTFLLCGLGRIFFRSPDIGSAFGYLGRIFAHPFGKTALNPELIAEAHTALGTLSQHSLGGFARSVLRLVNIDIGYGITLANVLMSLVAILVLWIVDVMQEKQPLREALSHKKLVIRWLVILIGIFAVIIFGIYGPGYNASAFIYEKF